MSGFSRASRGATPGMAELSTGIPSLDIIFKPDAGTITAFYEDENSMIHDTILQAFLSHSVSAKLEKTFACSEDPSKLIYFERKTSPSTPEDSNLRAVIAWRYSSLNIGNDVPNWNLSKKNPLSQSNIVSLKNLKELLKANSSCMIVLFSLFSPLHAFERSGDLKMHLFELRKLARKLNHTIFISIPTFLHEFDPLPFLDNVFTITTQPRMVWEESRYACLLEIKKITTVGRLRVNSLDSLKYGLKLSSKGIFIESIDIPPEESMEVPGPCS